ITMRIDGTEPFATAKPDARLIKLLIRARLFNASLVGNDGVPFAVLAKREGVSPSYFTRLVRLGYLAPDITQAILDGRQPRNLTAAKLLAQYVGKTSCRAVARTSLAAAKGECGAAGRRPSQTRRKRFRHPVSPLSSPGRRWRVGDRAGPRAA